MCFSLTTCAVVGINPRPARPRDTTRTECIDAYARAPAYGRAGPPSPGGPPGGGGGGTAGWGAASAAVRFMRAGRRGTVYRYTRTVRLTPPPSLPVRPPFRRFSCAYRDGGVLPAPRTEPVPLFGRSPARRRYTNLVKKKKKIKKILHAGNDATPRPAADVRPTKTAAAAVRVAVLLPKFRPSTCAFTLCRGCRTRADLTGTAAVAGAMRSRTRVSPPPRCTREKNIRFRIREERVP